MEIPMCEYYRDEMTYGGTRGYCEGTKEQDSCKCGGNPLRCDFYPEKIEATKEKYNLCCENCEKSKPQYDTWCYEHCRDGVPISDFLHDKLPLMWEPLKEESEENSNLNTISSAKTNAPSMVNHPQHYNQGGIECIDAANAMVSSYPDPINASLSWQVIKYLWRHPFKAKPVEDLKKCQWYLDRLINYLENKENS